MPGTQGVQTFYCWIKLSKRSAAAAKSEVAMDDKALPAVSEALKATGMSAADADSLTLAVRNGGIPPHFFNGGIPPHFFNGGIPPWFFKGAIATLLMNGGIPPGAQLGGAFATTGWWAIDEQFAGDADIDLVVGFQPVQGTREDAVKWLDDHPDWFVSAETYFLAIFAAASNV